MQAFASSNATSSKEICVSQYNFFVNHFLDGEPVADLDQQYKRESESLGSET